MISVVTMSANTAAYAAEAVRPSQRVRGDSEAEEAFTLLNIETKARAQAVARTVAPLGPTSLSLMFMSAHGQLPQGTTHQAISRYLENSEDIEPRSEQQGEGDDEGADEREEAKEDAASSLLHDMFAVTDEAATLP